MGKHPAEASIVFLLRYNMGSIGQRLTALFVRTFVKADSRHGIPVYDLRAGEQSLAAIDHALERLQRASPEYLDLVREHIRAIHVSRGGSYVLAPSRVVATPLQGREATDALYLSSRLVWTAQYLQAYNAQRGRIGADQDRRLRAQAFQRQLDFVGSVGADPQWVSKLRAEIERLAS